MVERTAPERLPTMATKFGRVNPNTPAVETVMTQSMDAHTS